METKVKKYSLFYGALQLFLPLCTGLGYLIHRPFALTLPWLEVLALAGISIWLTKQLRRQALGRWQILLLPLSLLNGIFLLAQGIPGGIAAAVCIGCGWMVLHRTPKGVVRGSCYALCALLCAGLLLLLPLWGFAQIMVVKKVITRVDSPDGSRTAIVRSIDQGALGGDTLVEVRSNRTTIPILLGSFVDSRQIWTGGWGDWEDMDLHWTDENTLVIHGIAYTVAGADAPQLADISHTLGAGIRDGRIVTQWDTHGGFHGDGSTFAQVRGTVTVPDSPYWHTLPAPPEFTRLAGFCLDEKGNAVIPEVRNGDWFFYNRHSSAPDHGKITEDGSWNFTLAVYDRDEECLYYFEFDT